jgi:HlyD family secretion protein
VNRKSFYALAAVAATCATLGAYSYSRTGTNEPKLVTRQITRGDVVHSVSATGTLDAVTTVAVGTQVSGTVATLSADFNSIVRKGQVIATLEPSLFSAQVEQARANLDRAQSDEDRLQVAAKDAAVQLNRARALSEQSLISPVDLETADVAKRTADAQVRSAQAARMQSQAALDQANVSLGKATITAPIDGIVISRNVDVGQTVAASVQAPTLFVLAADLTKMRLSASIDESDVGVIQPGQTASFRVGAYPNAEFSGTLFQLRLNPTIDQNVVTYAAIIDVPNADLKLKPGMTATITIVVDQRRNVLRVPNAALQYRPAGTQAVTGSGVWSNVNGTVSRVPVKAGVTDGTYTELIAGNLAEGAAVVTGTTGATVPAQNRSGAGPLGSSSGPGFGRSTF